MAVAKKGSRTQKRTRAASAAKPAPAKAAPAAKAETPKPVKITWLRETCPKRPGSAAEARASVYWGAETVAEYHERGGTKADLKWDEKHEFLKLG